MKRPRRPNKPADTIHVGISDSAPYVYLKANTTATPEAAKKAV